jgi:hypothetical protein
VASRPGISTPVFALSGFDPRFPPTDAAGGNTMMKKARLAAGVAVVVAGWVDIQRGRHGIKRGGC